MKKSFLSIAIIINLLIISSTISFGQSDFFYDNLMPEPVHPAPSSFNSALKVEPSMIYGKIQVSYPIYTFKLKDYTLPISLNYSSAGVRVMDVSDWVGLGWNINAGGVIVRNTRGYPDDYKSEYISHRFNEDWSHSEHHNKAVVGAFYCGDKYTADALEAEGTSSDIQDEIDDAMFFHNASTVLDAEPDEFAFACGPYSGSFYFNSDGIIRIKSDAKLKIEYTREVRGNDWLEITSFTITTPDGVKYKFGTTEDSRELKYDYVMQSNCKLRPQELSSNEAEWIRIFNGLFYTSENNCNSQPTALPNDERFIQVAYFHPIFEKEYWQRFQKFNIHDYIYKWYLKEIITPQKNNITFNYQSGAEVQYVTDFNESISVMNLGLVNVDGLNPLFTYMIECGVYVEDWTSKEPYTSPHSFGELLVCPHYFDPTVLLTFSNQSIKYTPKYLSSIVASNGYKLVFNTSNDRPDMPGAKRLNEVDIQYNSSTFKKVGLEYETYHSNEPNIMPELEIGNESFKRDYQFRNNGDVVVDFQETEAMLEASKHRLFLSSITEYDEYNNSLPPYEFKYNNDIKLPRRISNFRSSSGYFVENLIYTRIGLHSSDPWKAGGLNIENHNVAGFYPFDSKYKIITGQELNIGLTGTDVKSGLLKEIDISSGSKKKINYSANTFYGCSVTSIDSYDDDNLIKSEDYSFTERQGRSRVFKEGLDLGYFDMDEFIIGVNKQFACYGCYGETVNVRAGKTKRRYNIHQYNYYSYNIINKRYDSETSAIYKKNSVNTNENGSVLTSIKPYSENEPIWYDHDFNPQVKQISSSSMTTDNDAESAMLLSKEIKDSDGNVLINETYNIDSLSGGRICNGMYPYRLLKYENSASVTPRFYGAIYWNSNKWVNYTKVTKTESFGSGKEITQTKLLGYNTNLKLKTEETIEYDAVNSDKVLTKFSGEYIDLIDIISAFDASGEAFSLILMKWKHMLNYPVEKLIYKNGKIIGGSLVKYQKKGNLIEGFKIYPYQEYRLVVSSPIDESDFLFSHINTTTVAGNPYYSFENDSRYELVRTYDKFDDYGNILQFHDQYNINTAFYWDGDFKQFNTAQVSNANWFDIYYNSYEYGTISSHHNLEAHSGKYSYKLMSGESFNDNITDVVQNKKYKLTAWIKTENGFDSYADVLIKVLDKETGTVQKAWLTKHVYDTRGEWKLVERIVDLEDRNIDLAGYTGDVKFQVEILNANSSKYLLVDDVRLHPIDAQMTTSTYDPVQGITSKSDLTGKVSRYEYDNFNRLKLIKDDNSNILEKYSYHYKGEPIDETNNYLPDLTLSNLIVPSEINYTNIPFSVSLRVNNISNVASEPCKLSIYMMGSGIWKEGLDYIDVDPIMGKSYRDITFQVDLPDDLPHYITFFLGAVINHPSLIVESNYMNNMTAGAIKIIGSPNNFIDLVFSNVRSHDFQFDYVNKILDVDLSISNTGIVASAPCKLKYYVKVKGSDYYQELGQIDLDAINGVSTIYKNISVDLSNSNATGVSFYLKYEIDSNSQNTENNESNNTFEEKIILTL